MASMKWSGLGLEYKRRQMSSLVWFIRQLWSSVMFAATCGRQYSTRVSGRHSVDISIHRRLSRYH